MKTHRCEKLLKSKVSIRHNRYVENSCLDMDWNTETWRLFSYHWDNDWDCMLQHHVSEIKYCPFCGEKLD